MKGQSTAGTATHAAGARHAAGKLSRCGDGLSLLCPEALGVQLANALPHKVGVRSWSLPLRPSLAAVLAWASAQCATDGTGSSGDDVVPP
jgi:hypothetical protein